MSNTHRLGRRACLDDRSKLPQHQLAKHLSAGAPLPNSKLWGSDTHHLDQGVTSTCVGHGWCNFLRCAPIRSKVGEPMAYNIYKKAILLDPWKENDVEVNIPDGDPGLSSGTTVHAGAKAVTALHDLSGYAWAFELKPTIEWLLTKGPVVVGVNWYDSFDKPDSSGLISISPSAQVVGGHCFCIRGANQKISRVRNIQTWGDTWALKGDFFLRYSDLERLIHEDGEVCTAIQSN